MFVPEWGLFQEICLRHMVFAHR